MIAQSNVDEFQVDLVMTRLGEDFIKDFFAKESIGTPRASQYYIHVGIVGCALPRHDPKRHGHWYDC